MDFLGLLSVLSITQIAVLARPSDMVLKTKRSTDEQVFKPLSMRFPTQLDNGFTVIINGTLDPKSEMFEVVFPSNSRKEDDHCRIKYDFKNNKLFILPKHPNWVEGDYALFTEEGHPTFSIKLAAWRVNDKNMFKVEFEGNDVGPSEKMTCFLDKFEDFERVEFKSGLHSITSFLTKIDPINS